MKLKSILLYALVGVLMNNPICSQEDTANLKIGKEFENKLEDNKVIIEGFYKEPPSFYDKKTIILNGVTEGEFIEIKIQGNIKDFEHVKLEMRSAGHLIETEILNKFEQLSNQTLIIKAYIPEGIPIEKVKWKSLSGNEYEFIIGEDGREGGLQEVFNLN
jgi:hypothetical protein